MKAGKGNEEEFLDDSNFKFSEHFSYHRVLGKGSFGHVVRATSKSTLEIMAVKVPPLFDGDRS